MRRLIKSSGPRARAHVRDTHTPLLNPCARINTHLHEARLVYTWPLGRAKAYSLSKVLECIVSHRSSLLLSLSLSHLVCRRISRPVYLSSSPRYRPRIVEQEQCTLSSERCNAVTPGIASRGSGSSLSIERRGTEQARPGMLAG